MYVAWYIVILVLSMAIVIIQFAIRQRQAMRDSVCLWLSLVLVACLILLAIIWPKDLFFGLTGAGFWLLSVWFLYRARHFRKKSDKSLKELQERLMPGEHVFTDYKAIHEARNADEARRKIC